VKKNNIKELFKNKEVILKIGKIDMNVINAKSLVSLYYKFPLIERLVLEIYKAIPGSNIEIYEQGTMKTINSIIDNNQSIDVLGPKIKDIINKYFFDSNTSPRNILFHPKGEGTPNIKVDFEEINELIKNLLNILIDVVRKNKNFKFKKIKKL